MFFVRNRFLMFILELETLIRLFPRKKSKSADFADFRPKSAMSNYDSSTKNDFSKIEVLKHDFKHPINFFSWFGEFLIFDFFGHRAPLDGQHLRISETQDVFDIVGVFGIFKRLNMFRSYRWLSSYHLRHNVCSHRGRSARVYRSISPDLHPVEMFTQFIDLPSVRPVHRSSTLVLNRIIIIESYYNNWIIL